MTGRAALIGCVAVLAFFAGITGIRLAYTLTYSLLFLLVLAYGWSRAVARRIEVVRESPEGTRMVGEPFVERFTVRNGSRLPVAFCEVQDQSGMGGYHAGRVCALRAGDAVRWTAQGRFARRGRLQFGPLVARLGDPFGLFPRTVQVAPRTSVLVHPALHPAGDFDPVWTGAGGGDLRHGRRADIPPDTSTVREYDPSDGLSRIHWMSSARAGHLMSRTYDTQYSSDILVLLDLERGHHAGTAPESSLEYAVSVAASICHAAIRRGQAIALVTNDAEATAFGAGRGEAQRQRILDYLAEATDHGRVSLASTLRKHATGWRGRGGVIAITANRDPDWVEALLDASVRGVRHRAVYVDPVSFGAPGSPLRVPAAWRLAIDWSLVRRGDTPVEGRPASASGF